MSAEQRRQLTDAQQLFGAWWPAECQVARSGSLFWNRSKERRYLYEKKGGVSKSLGRETPELIQRKLAHDDAAKRARALGARIDKMAPVNRAIGLARLPAIAAKVLRELDKEQLLGASLIVTGTNALYAYEAACGVLIGGEHVATNDADLLWDARRSLLLAGASVDRVGVMSILRRVDRSFETTYGLNATNKDGYIVDLFCPEAKAYRTKDRDTDLEAVAMPGAEWLLEAPRFEQVIVGGDGMPCRIVVPDVRTFALHKLWVSKRKDRTPVKKPRDREHAAIVQELAVRFLGLEFTAAAMPWLPAELRALVKTVDGLKPLRR